MTPDSSALSSIRVLDYSIHVLAAYGTSLPVASHATLSTSSFHVARVPRLTLQLFYIDQITL